MESTGAGRTDHLARIASGQDRLVSLMERRQAPEDMGPDAESRMRLRSIDVQLLKLLEEVAAGRIRSSTWLDPDSGRGGVNTRFGTRGPTLPGTHRLDSRSVDAVAGSTTARGSAFGPGGVTR